MTVNLIDYNLNHIMFVYFIQCKDGSVVVLTYLPHTLICSYSNKKLMNSLFIIIHKL